jgi:cell wall-associated NlpC family hydrolase
VRRPAIASFLAFATVAIVSGSSRADEVLTVDLPPSRQVVEAAADSVASAADAVTLTNRKPQPSNYAASTGRQPGGAMSTKKFGSRGGQTVNGTKQFTVGRLGVVTKTAPIRASRTSSRSVLSRVQSGTYLALNCENGNFYGVLMADRTTGWVRKSDVKMLEYEVVSNRPADAAAYTANSASDYGRALLTSGGNAILDIARGYLGVPYKWGGTTANGLDCSAFVQQCFGSVGIRLPRTAREQVAYGLAVSSDQLQSADRLYFANSSGNIVHTGIYIGNGYFIHSSSKHKGVTVSNLSEDLYRRMYAGARR